MSEASSTRYCSRCLNTFDEDLERCPNLACRRQRPSAGWGRMYGPGDLFDRHYRIHNLLALGGAGVTYLAREVGADGEETGPRLALKVLFASRDEGPYLRRLATEAQIIQELNHPNIVQYLGFVHRSGHSPYLVTRFESGGSLLDHIKRVGSLTVRQSAHIARQICWALEKAHTMGIVHRDLKPENVLLSREVGPGEDPVVRVADFGIAKVQGSLGSQTRVGAFVGTPQYAAPEQFIGGNPSPATDVYGVGALLYFCTTVSSVVRFADRLEPSEGYQLLVDALPPSVVRAQDAPEDVRRLNRILEVCMDPDPLRRCRVEQLDGLLAALLADREPEVERARPPSGGSATQAPEVEATEPVRVLESGATTPFPTADLPGAPKPLEKRADAPPAPAEADKPSLGLLAGLAAGAAIGAAAGALAARAGAEPTPSSPPSPPAPPPPPPAEVPPRTATLSPSPAPAPTRPPTAPTDEPAAAPRPRRRGLSCLVVPLLALGLAALVPLGWAGLAAFAPQQLPAAARLQAEPLDPSRPAHARLLSGTKEALLAQAPALRQRCGASGKAHLQVNLVVEPRGQVRSFELSKVGAGLDPRCATEALRPALLPAPGWRPVRFALELDL